MSKQPEWSDWKDVDAEGLQRRVKENSELRDKLSPEQQRAHERMIAMYQQFCEAANEIGKPVGIAINCTMSLGVLKGHAPVGAVTENTLKQMHKEAHEEADSRLESALKSRGGRSKVNTDFDPTDPRLSKATPHQVAVLKALNDLFNETNEKIDTLTEGSGICAELNMQSKECKCYPALEKLLKH